MDGTNINLFIGKKVNEIRLVRCLTQTEVADVLDISFQQLQKYERGTNAISLEKLITLTNYFHVGLEYFIPNKSDDRSDTRLEVSDRKGGELLKLFNNIKSPDHRKMCLDVVKMLYDKDQDISSAA